MQLLKDEHWLRVAKEANFTSEDDIREALGGIRDAAVRRYVDQLVPALKAFAQSANPESPATIASLVPFLETGVDAAMLERYELQSKTSTRLGGSVEWSVTNKAPLDSLYDSRFEINASNVGSTGLNISPGPMPWISDFPERMKSAMAEYRQIHQDVRPASIADVLSLFQPPLDSAIIDRVRKGELERSR
jgi:hypothetical protein